MDIQGEDYRKAYSLENELHLMHPVSRPIDHNGELKNFVGILRLLFDNVFSGIILCDRDCKILYMNKFYADLLRTNRDQTMGKNVQDYFPDSRIPIVLATGNVELGRRCSLQSDMGYLVNRIPVKCDGETVGVVLQTIFKDYTEISELMTRLNRLEKRVRYYKQGLESMLSTTYTFDSIIGETESLLAAKRLAEKYAKTDSPVLIVGSTGTGKELFAHAVHSVSQRKHRPFVCVNCAAVPRDLLESELFGYETGAFTGAHRKGKAGKIELAHRGTLFLDEIGDIPMNSQAKLLRVIETGRIEKIGSLKPVNVDFRLVAATNRNLKGMIECREFREDLFYRLNTMTLELPVLSDRIGDIPLLIRHFLQAIDKPKVEITEGALRILEGYAWPGNVRELKNVVERAGSLFEKDLFDVEHIPPEIRRLGLSRQRRSKFPQKPLSEMLASYEREIIREAVRAMQGNMSRTAKLLGISRSTLYEKCKALGLSDGVAK